MNSIEHNQIKTTAHLQMMAIAAQQNKQGMIKIKAISKDAKDGDIYIYTRSIVAVTKKGDALLIKRADGMMYSFSGQYYDIETAYADLVTGVPQ